MQQRLHASYSLDLSSPSGHSSRALLKFYVEQPNQNFLRCHSEFGILWNGKESFFRIWQTLNPVTVFVKNEPDTITWPSNLCSQTGYTCRQWYQLPPHHEGVRIKMLCTLKLFQLSNDHHMNNGHFCVNSYVLLLWLNMLQAFSKYWIIQNIKIYLFSKNAGAKKIVLVLFVNVLEFKLVLLNNNILQYQSIHVIIFILSLFFIWVVTNTTKPHIHIPLKLISRGVVINFTLYPCIH